MPDIYRINFTTRTEAEDHINVTTAMWTIPNFTVLLEDLTKKEIRTNKEDSKNPDENFLLKMQFIGIENDLIEIYYLAPAPMFLKSVLTICLKCYKERSIVMKEYHMVQANKWQFLGVLFKRDILCLDGSSNFLDDGSLRLKFQFMINKGLKVDLSNVPNPQLSNDLQGLLKNPSFSDVTFVSAEGLEFPSHKAVLASRSAVLKAHFEHNMRECQTNIIESPLEAEVLQEVLTYIYTDNTPKVHLIPEKLLAAADYYQMSRLKHLCEEALQQRLTVDNAIETLQLAELHSATNLKRMTLEFIKDGHAKMIISSSSWMNLNSVTLIKTIIEFIINDGHVDGEDLL